MFAVTAVVLLIIGLIRRNRLFSIDHLIILAGAACAAWFAWAGYSIETIAQIVFPPMAALSLAVCAMMLYRHYWIVRSTGVIHTAIYLLLNFVSTAILALITGKNAETFYSLRPYIVLVWYLTVILLAISLQYQIAVSQVIARSFDNAQE